MYLNCNPCFRRSNFCQSIITISQIQNKDVLQSNGQPPTMPTEIRCLREPSHHVNHDDNDEDMSSPFSSGSSFTKKLYDIIDSAESTEIVAWSKGRRISSVQSLFIPLIHLFLHHFLVHLLDGTAFEVKDPKRLELEILPKYFRHARFQSFVRQLNFYSFKKISKERNSWVYSHEYFQRGNKNNFITLYDI